jgi:NitT/TauT family transport system substrate-binding protein
VAGNAISAHLAAKEYFEEAGLKVEFVDITSGAAAIPMLVNGQLDIALGDGIGTLTASANGVPLAIVGVATVQPEDPKLDATGIFTNNPSAKAADLSGKSFAVFQLGGAAELVARSAIDAEGGDSSQVNFVELQAPQMAAAIKADRVSAALITEPFATAAEKEGLTILNRPQAVGGPGLPAIYWITSQAYGQKNPAILDKFATSIQKANREANSNPAVARETAAGFLQMEPTVLNAMRLPVFAEDVTDTSKVSQFVDLANRYNVLKKQPDLDKLLSLKTKVLP